MADLDVRTDSFISLLLEVSGRARPSDLQALNPAEAADALRRYAAAHPERGLVFDGDSLVPAAGAQAASAPATPAPPATDDGMFEFGPAPAPSPSPAMPMPGDLLAGTPASSQDPAAMSQSVAELTPAAAPQAAAPVPEPASYPPPSDFVELPPLEGVTEASQQRARVPVYWWLLAVFFGVLGGLLGWLALRGSDPKGAKMVLLVGVAVTVLAIVLAVAAFFLGAAAFIGMASTG